MIFLSAYGLGSLVWGVLFSLHLIIIGYLILASNLVPHLLGGLFVLAGLAYFILSFGQFALPQYSELYQIIIMSSILAELAFALWLVAKGINTTHS